MFHVPSCAYLATPQEEKRVRQQLGSEPCRLPSCFFKTFMVSVTRLVGWLGAHNFKILQEYSRNIKKLYRSTQPVYRCKQYYTVMFTTFHYRIRAPMFLVTRPIPYHPTSSHIYGVIWWRSHFYTLPDAPWIYLKSFVAFGFAAGLFFIQIHHCCKIISINSI